MFSFTMLKNKFKHTLYDFFPWMVPNNIVCSPCNIVSCRFITTKNKQKSIYPTLNELKNKKIHINSDYEYDHIFVKPDKSVMRSMKQLPILKESISKHDIIENAKLIFDNKDGKIFTCLQIGLYTQYFVRRNNINDEIETFVMDLLDWRDTNKIIQLNEFVAGYRIIFY